MTTATMEIAPGRFRLYALEAKHEFLKAWRMPAFSLPTLCFPILFYVFFALVFGSRGGVMQATYLVATYGAFGVIGASLFGFGVGVAVERGQGWLLLKRASPMPPSAYFVAKMCMAGLFASIIVAALYALAAGLGNVNLAPRQWALLAVVHVVGSIPFCAMGLAAAYWSGPNSAVALVNLIYLPMAFLSGLWIPITMMPGMVQKIAVGLPAFHYSQLALKVIDADVGRSAAGHLAYLALFTLICLALASWGARRGREVTYG